MKRENILTALLAAALAFALSFGAAGAMVTGFDLNLESMARLAGICGFFSLFSALCFLWKRGGRVILCLLALISGDLWHRGEWLTQTLQLIQRISILYDMGYGWGVLNFTDMAWKEAYADLPMAMIGSLIAMVTAWTLCRRKSAWLAAGVSLLPLLSCLVVTDTVPDAPYLFLLMTGMAMLILTNGVRQESAAQGNHLTLLTAIPVTLAMAGLFLLIPQEGYVNQAKEIREAAMEWITDFPRMLESTAQTAAQAFSGGEPEEVDLKTLDRRSIQTYPVMEVTAEEGGTVYLRGQDYDVYSGTGWSASPHRAEDFSVQGVAAGTVTVRTRIRKNIFYMPYYPAEETQLTAGKLRNDEGLREYTFSRCVLPDNWHDIATAPPVYDSHIAATYGYLAEDWNRYLTLPNHTRLPAETTVNALLTGLQTTTEKAEAIGEFVKRSAEYDLNTGRMPEEAEDFALWFLENADTGYCVHFATAAVVLLRAADIPARYVSGYMVEAEAGKTVTVTAKDAHAWAEYYDSRLDTWLVLEATPSDGEETGETRPAAAPLPSATEAPETIPPEETEPPVPTGEAAATPRPTGPQGPDFGPLKALAAWLLSLAAAVLAVDGQRSVRLILRKKKQHSGSSNAQALARWQETELLAKLLKQTPPEDLLMLAQKAKFSRHALSEEELARFESYLRSCRRQLRRQPWYKKWLYQYIFAVI